MASFGGVTLTRLKTLNVKRTYIGSQTRAHDGTMLTDFVATKKTWTIKVEYLTQAERDTLLAKVDSNTSQTLVDLDGQSYTTIADGKSVKETRMPIGGGALYTIDFSVSEV